MQFGVNKLFIFFSRTSNRAHPMGFINFFVFEKIYSCLLTPNCNQNYVVTYTNFMWYINVIVNCITRANPLARLRIFQGPGSTEYF